MKKVKLWITDIDGTIVNYDGTCTDEMRDVIKNILNTDTKIVLATGRMFMGAYHAACRFNIKTPVVCYQGAVVRDENKVLWNALVNNDIAKEVINYLKSKNIHTHVYNDDTLYIDDDNKKIMDLYCNGRGTTYKVVDSLCDLELHSVPKILAVIEDGKIMESIKKELTEKYKGILTIVQSTSYYLEITDKNASKGSALNFLKKYWNLEDDEVIASGDQDNDIDMVKNAGIKICVGNNSEELKKIADYYCKSVNSNELVDYLKRFILCE